MAFSLSIAGVLVTITPSSTFNDSSNNSSNNNNASLSVSVRHCDDGHVEADLRNFSGTIVVLPEQPTRSCAKQPDGNDAEGNVVVDGIPEELVANRSAVDAVSDERNFICKQSTTNASLNGNKKFVPLSPHRSYSAPTIDTTDNVEDKEQYVIIPPQNTGDLKFHASRTTTTTTTAQDPSSIDKPPKAAAAADVDLSLHKACASDEIEISDLRQLLHSSPHLASIQDEYGDYPAHVFARNESFIYTNCDESVQEFAYELYRACPSAFLSEGYDGQIPFAGIICDWVDDCHQLYARSGGGGEVYRVSEIKSLTKSTRVVNSLCVRAEVRKLLTLPTMVTLPPKVAYSFKMLSFILDALAQSSFDDIPTRREFLAVASRRKCCFGAIPCEDDSFN